MTESEPAVLVRHARKYYGRGKQKHVVLDDLNMNVPKGSIYGLLGASGCGKTTLLSCIVGCQHFNSGEVWVLGGKPGSKHSGVPGPRVGYMPQDVALVGEFTVKGAITYFGWICGMSNNEIDAEFLYLSKLLDLPPKERYIKNLSGGQQRRVSFAAALVHSPELLILDEPTVGLDPILRSSIWQYLVDLTEHKHLTVIITTHYIEEAAQASKIGLLRGGKLLAENHPSCLMTMFNCSNLEEVFLILSTKQENSQLDVIQADSSIDCAMDKIANFDELSSTYVSGKNSEKKYNASICTRMKALLVKNFARLLRHIGGLCFLVIFPVLELVVFFYAIGGEPHGLRFAVVNEELKNTTNCAEYSYYYPIEPLLHEDLSCDFRGLSCNYLNRVKEKKIYYKDIESALASVKSGYAAGLIYFSRNFSRNLQRRIDNGRYASNKTMQRSEIKVHLDMSDRQIAIFTQKQLLEAYSSFAEDTFSACNLSKRTGQVPIQLNEPIFGDEDSQNYATFMTPGLLVTMMFFLATSLTSTIIITERNEGVWDRSLVAGVTSGEILFSHIFTQSLCVLVQLIIVLVLSFYVFNVPCVGNSYTMVILVGLQGFCGMCFGFLVSTLCDNITTANYLGLGSFYPSIFLSGMMWPLEGMPTFLQWIAKCLPSTIAILSLHEILERGRSFMEKQVYNGMIVTIFWIFFQVTMCYIILKIRAK